MFVDKSVVLEKNVNTDILKNASGRKNREGVKEKLIVTIRTLVGGDGKIAANEGNTFKCVSCKSEWNEKHFVMKHWIQNTEVYFCLNCEDWVQEKEKVLDRGWSLFDQDGYLDQNV